MLLMTNLRNNTLNVIFKRYSTFYRKEYTEVTADFIR